MRDNFCYWIGNITLLSSFLVALTLVLLGYYVVADTQPFKGFIVFITGVGYVVGCGCAMALNIKRAFKSGTG